MAGLIFDSLVYKQIHICEFTNDQSAEALFMPYTNSIEKA